MHSDDLVRLGLTWNEAAVYQAVLEHGPCFVAPIIQATRKHRQVVYNALEGLQKKYLVAVTKKNGKNFYASSDPKQLVIETEQKQILAKRVAEEVERKLSRNQERIEIFSGLESYERGLASFRLQAEAALEYIVIGGEARDWYVFNRSFFLEHVERVKFLKKKGAVVMILFYEGERKSAEEFIGPYLNNPYACKVAARVLRLPQTVWLAGEHVYLLTPTADPLVIHINSHVLAEEYRKVFWEQWKQAQPLRLEQAGDRVKAGRK